MGMRKYFYYVLSICFFSSCVNSRYPNAHRNVFFVNTHNPTITVKDLSIEENPVAEIHSDPHRMNKTEMNGVQDPPEPGNIQDSVPYYINVENETLIQRSFMFYDSKVLTYCISIGNPEKVHYSINSYNGAIIKGWRGQFLNANLMWVHKARGIGVAQPVGEEIAFGNEKAYATVNNGIWKDSIDADDNCQFLGYDVDKQNRPTFRYKIKETTIEDIIRPANNNINRVLHFPSGIKGDLFFRLISGNRIKKIKATEYLVDDSIRIKIPKNNKVIIQANNDRQMLLTKLSTDFEYTISW